MRDSSPHGWGAVGCGSELRGGDAHGADGGSLLGGHLHAELQCGSPVR